METPEYELDDENDFDSEEEVGSDSSDLPAMQMDGAFSGSLSDESDELTSSDLDSDLFEDSEDFDLFEDSSEVAVGDDESDFFDFNDAFDPEVTVGTDVLFQDSPEDDEADFFQLSSSDDRESAVGDSWEWDSLESEEAVGSESFDSEDLYDSDDSELFDSSDDFESAVGESYSDELDSYEDSDEFEVGDPYSLHYEVEVGDDDDDDDDEDEVGFGFEDSEHLSDDEVEAFNSFAESIGVYDDDESEFEVGMSDDDDDSMEVDLGQSKKDKMLLVYFLKKVLKGLPLPVRVLFVRRFKKRYQNQDLRGRMLEIVKKMRGTMKQNIQGEGFRDKLKTMINRIRERITKHYSASRSLMAAKQMKASKPETSKKADFTKDSEDEDDDKPPAKKAEKAESPPKEAAKKPSKEPEDEEDEEGPKTFSGKNTVNKFYGNNPVVVYYVPIIAGTSDEAVSEQLKDAPAKLKKTVREKLLELQRKQKD